MVPIQPIPVDSIMKALQMENVGSHVCCVHVPL